MGLFGTRFRKLKMMAPLSGKVVPITEAPDSVFSNKVLGDGVAVIPSSGKVLSPVSGTIVQIAHSLHAICLEGDDGAEILIHLGIDTVSLEGKGFTCCVREGQHVVAGEELMEMDLELIKTKGLSTVSPCIITNLDRMKDLSMKYGDAVAGETVVMTYKG
ncbi:PTS system glucose-specific EIIA component [Caprobacter fermentans]|uniref:PTS system glucose-specific EIIA component n=1 Tax=Caproicibacter fermentans TaxID=2576756 RepID=A0A6N8I249_9FIRM|nr:PTS glucose transporter subunit IIA [Caproicibacter fermentans]MVB11800.1 PTS system glucose-specific EIIA component [Caproicibacter fermentans]OCN00783.1 hypothetical protein A7X67_08395 [Clostridium sp. W14A]